MSAFATIRLIAGREIRQRLRSKLFTRVTIGLSVLLLLVALVPVIVGLVDIADRDPSTEPEAVPVAIVGDLDARERAALVNVLGEVDEVAAEDEEEAARLIGAGEASLAVVVGERVLQAPPDTVLMLGVDPAARVADALAVARVLADAGLEPAAVGEVLSVGPLPVEIVGPHDPGREFSQLILANIGVVFLFAVLTLYATMIVNGIIEEKGSRVVELLIETVPVRQLMVGKLLGLGIVGLGQTVVLFGPATVALVVAGTVALPGGGIGPLLLILLWFLGGYAFYSVVSAALGALVSRPEESQAVLTPASLLMVAGYLIGFFSGNAPDGSLATIAGWVPPTAPYVMLVRQLLGSPTPLEVAGAALGVLVASALLAVLAARIYEGGILRTGARVRLRDAWRSTRDDQLGTGSLT